MVTCFALVPGRRYPAWRSLGICISDFRRLLDLGSCDNKTIGLLICKSKDRIEAQYALESSSQPISISEYELEKFYPEKLEGTIPSIEEIERKLNAIDLSFEKIVLL